MQLTPPILLCPCQALGVILCWTHTLPPAPTLSTTSPTFAPLKPPADLPPHLQQGHGLQPYHAADPCALLLLPPPSPALPSAPAAAGCPCPNRLTGRVHRSIGPAPPPGSGPAVWLEAAGGSGLAAPGRWLGPGPSGREGRLQTAMGCQVHAAVGVGTGQGRGRGRGRWAELGSKAWTKQLRSWRWLG